MSLFINEFHEASSTPCEDIVEEEVFYFREQGHECKVTYDKAASRFCYTIWVRFCT